MEETQRMKNIQSVRRPFRRILTIIGLTLAVLISLLTFPAALPWMIAAWLLWHTVIVRRGQAGWVPLGLYLVILAVKRPYWSPPLIVLAIFSVLIGGVNLLLTKTSATDRPRKWTWLGAGVLWSLWAFTAIQWVRTSHCQRQLVLDPARATAPDSRVAQFATLTANALAADDFSFSLLLPDDDAPLSVRTDALSQWCGGFLYGLALGGFREDVEMPGNVSEVMKDFYEISHARFAYEATDDADEAAYMEIVEYVRMSVLLLHEELQPLPTTSRLQ